MTRSVHFSYDCSTGAIEGLACHCAVWGLAWLRIILIIRSIEHIRDSHKVCFVFIRLFDWSDWRSSLCCSIKDLLGWEFLLDCELVRRSSAASSGDGCWGWWWWLEVEPCFLQWRLRWRWWWLVAMEASEAWRWWLLQMETLRSIRQFCTAMFDIKRKWCFRRLVLSPIEASSFRDIGIRNFVQSSSERCLMSSESDVSGDLFFSPRPHPFEMSAFFVWVNRCGWPL